MYRLIGQHLAGLAPHHEDAAAHQLGGITRADGRRIDDESSQGGEEKQTGGDDDKRQQRPTARL